MSGDKGRQDPGAARHPLDALTASPDNHRVLMENEAVRVLDTWVAPGARTAVHVHEWPAALYVLSWSDFVRRDPGGAVLLDSRTLPARPSPGEALWAPPLVPHYVENIGDTELRVIAVELKTPV